MDNTVALDTFLEAYLGLNKAWSYIETAKSRGFYDEDKLAEMMEDIWGIQEKIVAIRKELHNR